MKYILPNSLSFLKGIFFAVSTIYLHHKLKPAFLLQLPREYMQV